MDGNETREYRKSEQPVRDSKMNENNDSLMSICLEKDLLISDIWLNQKINHTYAQKKKGRFKSEVWLI